MQTDEEKTVSAESDLPEQSRLRRENLDKFKAAGIDPFPSRFDRSHTAGQLQEQYKELPAGTDTEDVVRVAGRIMSWRESGKINFADLHDDTGKLQLFLALDKLGEEQFQGLRRFDIGDIVGLEGIVRRTKRGELSVAATKVSLLTKCLHPLPEKWHGIKDIDQRYRKRYLDLLMSREQRDLFRKRTAFTRAMRKVMDEHGFLEVETPVLEQVPGGADARPFITHHNTLDADFYLRISLELHLKRLIVGGYDKVYELGRVFRNEGMSTQHLQEFTMMEFYWAYVDYEELMQFIEELYTTIIQETFGTLVFQYEGKTLDFTPPWPLHDYKNLIQQSADIDLDKYPTTESLIPLLKERGIAPDPKLGRGRLIDQLYKKLARPKLFDPCFLVDHPLDISPLAKGHPDRPGYVQRFQVLFAGAEVGNGFSELNDAQDQLDRFLEQKKLREKGDPEAQMLDRDFIESLEYGMPPTSGFGVGLDRFFAILAGAESIRDVVLFPTMKPLE